MKKSLLAFGLTLFAAQHANAARIESVTYNGSGCPVGSLSNIPDSFDGQWLTLDFARSNNSLRVAKGGDASLEESRRNCIVSLRLDNASDYRFAVQRVVSWGQYQIGDGDLFQFTLANFFEGQGTTKELEVSARGPSGWQSFTFDRNISDGDLLWSSCGLDRALSLNSSVRVGPTQDGSRETRSQGRLDKVAYRFTFQKCRR